MPNWNEQLNEIAALRAKTREDADQLYRAQLNLNATNALLAKSEKHETETPPNIEAIKRLRAQIEDLQSQIRKINEELNELNSLFEKIKRNQELLAFLQKKIETVSAQLSEAEQRIEEELQKESPDPEIVDTLTKKIIELKLLLAELRKDLQTTEEDGQGLRHELDITLRKKEALENSKGELRREVRRLEADLAGLLQPAGDNENGELPQKQREQQAGYERLKDQLGVSRGKLSDLISSLYVDPHPRAGLQQLDDNVPFLLLPVRIETRFIDTGNVNELWLRVYPDDIAIHTHEKLLTEKEVSESIIYWKALFNADKSEAARKEDLKKGAWDRIAGIFGPQRSAYVVLQMKPSNWNEIAGMESADELLFPSPDLTKPDSWTRAPRVNIFPDKFVVSLYEGNVIVREVVGNVIPDELFVGPDPMEAADSFITKDDKLVFGESFDWSADFEKAVLNGMGFKIPLTETQAKQGFTRIIVLGVFLSSDETSSKKMVEELIDNHHYSPKGFSLVPQGNSTNNTDGNGSGYTGNDAFSNTSYVVEADQPLFTENDDCDGKNLADALGIDYQPLQNILHSNGRDLAEAVAMNTALYPSTLGYYFDSMLDPVLNETQKDKVRDFFISHVTGRGPLPAIRVGDQPYGVLLTSDFDKWKWHTPRGNRFLFSFDDSFLDGLYAILKNYNNIWNSILNNLAYVGKPGKDASEILMNIIGLQASSASFYQRIGYSTDYLINLDDFQYGGKYHGDLQQSFNSKNNSLAFLQRFGYNVEQDGKLRVPQLLRLVFQHYHTTLDAANLIDNVPLSETDPVTYYDPVGKKNYLDWLAAINDSATLERQDFGNGKSAPSALLYLQLRRSLSLQLHNSVVKWFSKNNLNLEFTSKATNFQNIRPGGDLTKWEVMKAPVGAALSEHPQKNKSVSEFLFTNGRKEDEAAFLAAMKKSFAALAQLPTARLERCFVEHLDTCNYRLDAWQIGMFHLRLKQQRQLQQDERRTGIYLGAYGWVEDIRPAKKEIVNPDSVPEKLRPKNNEQLFEYSDNGGFIHAPSLNHASAAAVLRSGYISHATPENPDVMAVNLSSERVRRAMFILDGMRNGQSLEALLGYQFERGLHDRGSADNSLLKLNLYIYDFRDAFPLQYHSIHQEGTNSPQETIPPASVVNGVTLAENTDPFPFGAKGNVLTASANERAAIISEKDKLNDTLDAIKDLLSAESVYQLIQGNFERGGAVVNALKDAQIPPVIEVVDTPRGSHFTFTNRVTINFPSLDPTDPSNNPWPSVPMTPMATMEMGMNKWIGRILGDPQKIVFTVSHLDEAQNEIDPEVLTVSVLNVQPLDLTYMSANGINAGSENETAVSELENRIAYFYRRKHGLEDDVKIKISFGAPEHEVGKQTLGQLLYLLRQLRELITDSRFIHAKDFDPESKESLVDKNNPKALDHGELLSRIQQLHTSYKSVINVINNLPIHAEIPDADAGNIVTVYNTLKEAFAALQNAGLSFEEVTFTFSNANIAALQEALITISNFGVPDAFPGYSSAVTIQAKANLLDQAARVIRRITSVEVVASATITDAQAVSDIEKKISEYIKAGKLLLQEKFNILPLFTFNNEADVVLSHKDSAQLLKFAVDNIKMKYPVDEWMQNAAHVRKCLSRWQQVRSLFELYRHDELKLNPLQLPYRKKDSWVAVEFPEKDELTGEPFNILHDTLSIVIHGEDAINTPSGHSGLLIDDWTEMIPTNEAVTGISFNYNQPNASPPQTLLLAVTPEIKGHWTWEGLMGILNDTLHRAKLRAVEPQLLDELNLPELSILRPALLADFTQYDLNIALDYRMNLFALASKLPI